MDHFGIGAAMKSMAQIYSMSARGSGRTTSLIESLKNGDRVIFVDSREAERIKKLCLERDVTIECIICNPSTPERLFERGTANGRTMLDHSWVGRYYEIALERASKDIDHFERETSGYGVAHRETKRAGIEMAKWNF